MKKIYMMLIVICLSSCSSHHSRESVGEYIDNSIITTKVKSKLLNSEATSGLKINVKSYKGFVVLSGIVENFNERDSAVELARKVEGVQGVKDKLTLRSDLN